MALYEIGIFGFVNMSQPPQRQAQQAVNEVRPGKDGHAIFYTGSRGDPFTVRTVYDVPSGTNPRTVAFAYMEIKNELVELKYEDVVEPFQYQVLGVQIESATTILSGLGGVNGTSTGRVIAIWQLVQTKVVVPE